MVDGGLQGESDASSTHESPQSPLDLGSWTSFSAMSPYPTLLRERPYYLGSPSALLHAQSSQDAHCDEFGQLVADSV
jgi:hypothetical protein